MPNLLPAGGRTSLESYAATIVKEALANRGQANTGTNSRTGVYTTESKWASNLRAVIPEATRPSVAGLDEVWRESDNKEKWSSRAKSSGTLNAIKTAHDLVDDVLFRSGVVPFRCGLIGAGGSDLPMSAKEQAHQESLVERHLDSRHAKCDGVKHLLFGWDNSTMYGERYFHTFFVEDSREKSGIRPAFEAVNPWECFRDMDNEGPLEEGEYFMHRQRKAGWRLYKWAKDINSGSEAKGRGWVIDESRLRTALRQGYTDLDGTLGVNNTSNQTGTPETDDIMWSKKNEVRDDLWVWITKTQLQGWCESNVGCIQYQSPDAVNVVDDHGDVVGTIDASKTAAPDVQVLSLDTGEGSAPTTADMEVDTDNAGGSNTEPRVWCLVYIVNGKVVGVLPEPGDLPYRKTDWHRIAGVRDGIGIADLNSTNQVMLDGILKAIENDTKSIHSIIGYDQSQNLNSARFEEILARGPIAAVPLSKGLSPNGIRDMISATVIPSNAEAYMRVFQMIQQLQDLDTSVPRVVQGSKSEGDNTAFEMKQRLDNSGRHIGSKIRDLDKDIVWINATMLKMDIRCGNVQLPADVEIRGGGFREFTKQLGLVQQMFIIMDWAMKDPEIALRMNKAWVMSQLTESQGLDSEKFWVNEEEYQMKKQAQIQQQMNNPQMQLQMQQMQATIKAFEAKAAKDDASAQKFLAEAQAIGAEIQQNQQRLQLEQAQGAMNIAGKMREHQAKQKPRKTRQERRADSMDATAIVKRAA